MTVKNISVLTGIISSLLSIGYGITIEVMRSTDNYYLTLTNIACRQLDLLVLAMSGALICGGLTTVSLFISKLCKKNGASDIIGKAPKASSVKQILFVGQSRDFAPCRNKRRRKNQKTLAK